MEDARRSHGTVSSVSSSQDSDLCLVVGDSLKAEKELTASVTEVSGGARFGGKASDFW